MPRSKPLDELLADIGSHSAKRAFHPCAWYNKDGDTLEIYLSPEDYVAERVDPLWTVFVSPGDRERIVGFAIKKIHSHFGERGLNKVIFATGRRTVRVLVFAAELAQAFTLERRRSRKSKDLPAGGPPEKIARILDEFGDIRVTLENAGALAGVG